MHPHPFNIPDPLLRDLLYQSNQASKDILEAAQKHADTLPDDVVSKAIRADVSWARSTCAKIDAYLKGRPLHSWIDVSYSRPPELEREYQVLAISAKQIKDGPYAGQYVKGIYQSWVVRTYPKNYLKWMYIPGDFYDDLWVEFENIPHKDTPRWFIKGDRSQFWQTLEAAREWATRQGCSYDLMPSTREATAKLLLSDLEAFPTLGQMRTHLASELAALGWTRPNPLSVPE